MHFGTRHGFTLVEMLVVASIIGILMAVVLFNVSDARSVGRDAERKANLREVQAALEAYRNVNGVYPEGCRGTTDSFSSYDAAQLANWSGEPGTDYACPGGNPEYIVGLVPTFIDELPRDTFSNGSASYVYTTNQTRTVYKLMALDLVESETVSAGDEFFRCGETYGLGIALTPAGGFSPETWRDSGLCQRTPANPNGLANAGARNAFGVCTDPGEYENDYAVTGGISSGLTDTGSQIANSIFDKGVEHDTELVSCR